MRKRLFAQLLPPLAQAHLRLSEDLRRALLGDLEGVVLELGPGTGVNLPLFGPRVRWWWGLEPNPYLHPHLERALEAQGLPGRVLPGRAEAIPLPDGSVDAAVATLVLCSVSNLQGALREIQRVLKPGGVLVFLEHVAAPPKTPLRLAQDLFAPLWAFLGDGCHPNRETLKALEGAGFSPIQAQDFRLPLGLVAPHVAGKAYKPRPNAPPLPPPPSGGP